MLDSSNVRVAVTGTISAGAVGAAAPTGTASTLTGHTDVGWVGEDGVTATFPGSGDSTPIRGWQNGATVRTIRTPSEDNPTLQFVMLETKKENVELALGVTVTTGSTEGSYEYDTQDTRVPKSIVIDVVDGPDLIRKYVPRGVVTEIGDQVYANGEPIGWGVTLECERDATAGFNFKEWSTALKTVV